MGRIKEYAAFIKEFPRTFETTGALGPSSRGLARELVRPLRERDTPLRVLEVGPGTGAVTSELVKEIRSGDHVELVELNQRFVDILHQRFDSEHHFRQVSSKVKIWPKAVEELTPDAPFDVVICGLPFNNFQPELVKRIFRHMLKLVRPDGRLTFFEYLWIRRVKSLAASRNERRRLNGIGAILQRHLDRYEFRREIVWTNVPPAVVHHLRVPASSDETPRPRRASRKRSRPVASGKVAGSKGGRHSGSHNSGSKS